MPKYPGGHVQRYPVVRLTTYDPLFKHGEDEQFLTDIKTGFRSSSNNPNNKHVYI